MRKRRYSRKELRLIFAVVLFIAAAAVRYFIGQTDGVGTGTADLNTTVQETVEIIQGGLEQLDQLEEPDSPIVPSDEQQDIPSESDGEGIDKTPIQTDSPLDVYLVDVPYPDFDWKSIPWYDGQAASVEVNGGVPFFADEDTDIPGDEIWLSELDDLGRCGPAMIIAGPETIATAKRGSIGNVKPTGWQQNKYDGVLGSGSGAYLYQRAHLLMYHLCGGLNATWENLVTGTQYMNTVGMLGVEEVLSDYVHETGHHILYRVTPVFEGDDLLCRGVLMEAMSLEDDEISICEFVYNVQDGIELDYATGANRLAE